MRVLLVFMFLLTSCNKNAKIEGITMEENKFWEIVSQFSKTPQLQLKSIENILYKMSKTELIGFQTQLNSLKNQLIRADLYAPVELFFEGGGDDAFFDFKNFIVYQGRDAFISAQNNVDDLADILNNWVDYKPNLLDYTSIAYRIFEIKFGEDLGDYSSIVHSDQTEGEPIDINDLEELKSRFPKLWEIRETD